MQINRAEQLVDTAARRPLTPAEQAEWAAWLADHPEDRERLETELRLSRVLGTLLASPAPSNFTARVLAAVERETARRAQVSRRSRPLWWPPLWRWQWAVGAAVMLLVAGFLWRQQQQWRSRQEVVQSVQALTEVAGLPSLEMLQDFDAIYNLPAGPVPSVEELESALE